MLQDQKDPRLRGGEKVHMLEFLEPEWFPRGVKVVNGPKMDLFGPKSNL